VADITYEQIQALLNPLAKEETLSTFSENRNVMTKDPGHPLNKMSTSLDSIYHFLTNRFKFDKKDTPKPSDKDEGHTKDPGHPINRMAMALDSIYHFLTNRFKFESLGTEDKNIGRGKLDPKPSKKDPVPLPGETDEEEKFELPATPVLMMAGLLVAGLLKAIKDKLQETWGAVMGFFTKPIIAFRALMQGSVLKLMKQFGGWLGKIGTKLKGFSVSFKNWPRLTKFVNALLKPFRLLGKLVSGAGTGFTKLSKWLKPLQTALQKIIAPIVKVGGKMTGLVTTALGPIGTALKGFGRLLGWIAAPLTLVFEAFDLFSFISGGFTKNAEKLSDSLAEKGVLGRAWYGLTHMFTTIATFGYEFKEMVKAWWDVFANALKGVKDGFMNIVEGFQLKLLDMWNYIASSRMGRWFGMEVADTPALRQKKQEHAFKGEIKETFKGMDLTTEQVDKRIAKWKERGNKIGISPEEGDTFDSFMQRVKSAEATKKAEAKELPSSGGTGSKFQTPGLDRLSDQTFNIQNQTFNNQQPDSSRESFSGMRVVLAN